MSPHPLPEGLIAVDAGASVTLLLMGAVMTPSVRFGGLLILLLTVQAGAVAGPVTGQGTWETTLKPRDINRDGVIDAYFDTALNITWLADANAGAGSAFDDGGSNTDGTMNWSSAMAWAAALNVHGVTGWTLPSTQNRPEGCSNSLPFPTCGYGVDPTSSQMAHMYFVTLGNLSSISPIDGSAVPGGGLVNTANFSNLQASNYWSSTPASIDPTNYSWFFNMSSGYQTIYRRSDWHAWAVRDGDVLAVPEPGSVGLVLLALLGAAFSGSAARYNRRR